jgi:hypothetical protein
MGRGLFKALNGTLATIWEPLETCKREREREKERVKRKGNSFLCSLGVQGPKR